jgi:predicted ribosomally synthesized peptide with SipW-like signal peptide
MDRKVLVAFLIIGLVATLAGAGIYAYFNDTETSGENTFQAGTLDLKVDDKDDPYVVHIVLSDIAPGWHQGYKWVLKNTGSILGKVSVEFGAIRNLENGMNEPEEIAENSLYWGSPLGRAEGELGEYLSTTGGYYYPGLNDWHEFITSRNTGPPVPGRVTALGLDALGGKTYNTGVTLGPGEKMGFGLDLFLKSNLQAWDGCAQHDIDDNVIQGDSVEFDIIFRLEQVL